MDHPAPPAPLEVVAGIVWQDGRLLASLRPEGKALAGFWEFPGGKVEPGETAREALIRELREEVSLEAETVVYWKSLDYVYPQGPVRLHVFQVESFAGEAIARENQTLRWLYPHEALQLNVLPPDRPLLQELARSGATRQSGL